MEKKEHVYDMGNELETIRKWMDGHRKMERLVFLGFEEKKTEEEFVEWRCERSILSES